MVSAFPLLAAVLAAAVAAAVAWPLWRNGARAGFVASVLAVALATPALYLWVGAPAALEPQARSAPRDLDEGIARLQEALRQDPQRADGWALLGRSQLELGRDAEATAAYAQAVKLAPDEPTLLVEAAQARAQADPQRRFDDQAMAWLEHARALSPDAERASWLIGIAQRQRGQDAEAARTWETLLPRIDPAAAGALREQIDIARQAAGLPPLADEAATAAAATLTVKVALQPDFAERVRLRGDASVFVIARIPGGPPMPVAVEKHALQDLPLTVVLDDGDSPMPTQKLSALAEVEVLARLSASGNAVPQEGDLASKPVRVRLPAEAPVELWIGPP